MRNVAELKNGAAITRTEFAETGGRRIAYRSIGQGTPIILANRFRGVLDVWDPAFLDSLAEKHRVIIFDYSGFGLSTGKPATDMLAFANDVRDLATALSLDRIVVGGWSFGGGVAQIVAMQYPQLVSHLVLIGTKPPGKNAHPIEQLFFDTAWKPVNTFEDEIVLFFEPASEASRQAAVRSHERISRRTKDLSIPVPPELWDYYGKGFEDFERDPYQAREKLGKTKIPVLVVSGDHEICFPPENWFDLTRSLPTTQVIVVPSAGHGPHHQHPEMIATYVTEFVRHSN